MATFSGVDFASAGEASIFTVKQTQMIGGYYLKVMSSDVPVPDSAPQFDLPFDVHAWDRLHRPIWLYDPATSRGLYANPPALELWGADSLDELLARDFSQLSSAVRQRIERLTLATAGGATKTERWSFYPRGQPVTVLAIISSLEIGGGRTALLFEATSIDVGDGELRAVEALRHTSSLISLFDAAGGPIFANPAAFAAYGDGERGFADRFPDPEVGRKALREVLAGQILAELTQVRTAHGERFHYLDARCVTDPVTGAVGVLLSERDVTVQVEAERALRTAEERAEVAEAKERFLTKMSHDLRTPLNSVIGFAGLLAAGDLDEIQAGYLARISDAGATLLTIVNDLIDLSELEGGEVTLEPAPFDPITLVEDALVAIAPAARAKGLALALDVPEDLDLMLRGDARRIATVVSQYLSNAVKFTAAGQVSVRLATQAPAEGEIVLEVSVTDTGPGIDPAEQPRLFRRFAQSEQINHPRVGGAGVGLAISKALIGLMGGEVGVDSQPGQGSRFWFRLTLPVEAHPANDGAPDKDRPLTVLYADDHESNRVLVKALLESQGHCCDTVNDGAEAVIAARTGAYDLVLMDIQMPVQDGIGATIEIRAGQGREASLPIIALTANTLDEQRETYFAAGLDDCLAKPVRVAELFEKVTYWAAQSVRAGRADEGLRAG
jgi:signal transduction histidine kinase/ActR/RegA family two-component response regulator